MSKLPPPALLYLVQEERKAPSRSAKTGATRRAVIDVGTNSVKLLIADLDHGNVEPFLETSEQTRLGRGFYESHRLQPDAIKLTAEAVGAFAGKAKDSGALSVRVIATSAARDARNSQELIDAIQRTAQLPLEVISGEQEADLVFRGICTDAKLTRSPLLILDVGGGSTEFILGENGHQEFRESFQLGTVRLLEHLPHSDPPSRQELERCRLWLRDFLRERVEPQLLPALKTKTTVKLVGTGGTTTILARMQNNLETFDREVIESTALSFGQIQAQVERLWIMPLKERQNLVGLPPKRADVILFGAAIFEAILQQFHFAELQISMRGLRYAALLEA